MKRGQAILTPKHHLSDINLLVTDIDGTLLDPQGQLTDITLNALYQCAKKGIHIVLATGRNLTITQTIATTLVEAIQTPIYLIVQDGALILEFPSKQVLSYHNLSLSVAQKARDQFRLAKQSIMVFDPLPDGQGFLFCKYQSTSDGLEAYLGRKPGQYRHWPANKPLREASSKIVTIDDQIRVEALRDQLQTTVPEARTLCTEAVHLNAWFLEVGSLKAAKVQAVAALLAHLGLDWSTCIAVGDAENDIEMITAAGLGLAMGNASARVKQCADQVIGPNSQSGLGQFLGQLF
ncbi:MAG: HAD family hydrolase [Chloroflexota bacterium]